MSDMYRHMRHQSRLGSQAAPTPSDEDTAGGAWPTVARGKKGDILKLVDMYIIHKTLSDSQCVK